MIHVSTQRLTVVVAALDIPFLTKITPGNRKLCFFAPAVDIDRGSLHGSLLKNKVLPVKSLAEPADFFLTKIRSYSVISCLEVVESRIFSSIHQIQLLSQLL